MAIAVAGCKKRTDTFAFEGTVVGDVMCTSMAASISEFEIGYIVSLTTPDSIGGDYTNIEGDMCHNCVILYHTRSRFYMNDTLRGQMYLDNDYSAAYCNYHFHLGIPEGVCYSLE